MEENVVTWPFGNKNNQKKLGITLMALGSLLLVYTGGSGSIFGLPFDPILVGVILTFAGLLYFTTAN